MVRDLYGNFKLEVGKYSTNNALSRAMLNGSNISVSDAFNSFMGNISKKLKSHLIENENIEAHLIIAEPIPIIIYDSPSYEFVVMETISEIHPDVFGNEVDYWEISPTLPNGMTITIFLLLSLY